MRIGKVVEGKENVIKAVIDNSVLISKGGVELFEIGDLVSVIGKRKQYLGMITGLSYKTHEEVINRLEFLSNYLDYFVREFGESILKTSFEILLLGEMDENGNIKVAVSLPQHFSDVESLDNKVVSRFFGQENQRTIWGIGSPRTPSLSGIQELVQIPIDVKSLSKLSFGIFGKTGTGKTFLGNLLASFIIAYNQLREPDEKPIVLLIFDMHSEYGTHLVDAYGRKIDEGVGQKFDKYFLIYTPDHKMAEERNPELKNQLIELTIPVDDIELEGEILFMKDLLGLTDTFVGYLRATIDLFKEISREIYGCETEWKRCFWSYVKGERKVEEIVSQKLETKKERAFRQSLEPNVRKLRWIVDQDFVTWEETGTIDEVVNALLSQRPRSVIISMGRYAGNTVAYMLIANIIARKLKERIERLIQRGGELTSRIMIFLEEAHNFLGPKVFLNSPFGIIAREYRKRGVNLAVIDQRPSELDENVISMLWSKFVFALTSKKDIEVALLGVPFKEELEKVVPRLSERRVLVTGIAIRFPVVVTVADYKQKTNEVIKIVRSGKSKHEKIKLPSTEY